jgi:hypothetical protein
VEDDLFVFPPEARAGWYCYTMVPALRGLSWAIRIVALISFPAIPYQERAAEKLAEEPTERSSSRTSDSGPLKSAMDCGEIYTSSRATGSCWNFECSPGQAGLNQV